MDKEIEKNNKQIERQKKSSGSKGDFIHTVYKSKIPFKNEMNIWSTKKPPIRTTLAANACLLFVLFLYGLNKLYFAVYFALILLIFWNIFYARIFFLGAARTKRFSRLPPLELVQAIEETLTTNGLSYIKKSGGRYTVGWGGMSYSIKRWPLRYTEIFYLSDEAIFIELVATLVGYVPIYIGKFSEKAKAFIRSLTNILDDNINRKEDLYLEERFLEQLSDPRPKIRWGSAHCLGVLESKKALPFLSELLEKEQHIITRGAIIQAFGKIGDASVIPLLEKYLEDSEIALRENEEKVPIGKLVQEAIRQIEQKSI